MEADCPALYGERAEYGIGFTGSKRVMRQLSKHGEKEAAGTLRNAIIGAYWTESRLVQAGHASST